MSASDVLIVGAGASGAAAAWRLAASGVSVTCLEQGGWLDQRSAPSLGADWERALQTAHNANPNIRRAAADYPVVDDDTPIKPAVFNGVGGGTLRWGAHFPRMHPSDFRVRTLDGVADDWPLAYDELAPYYEINDRIMGVSGLAGDPANPPREARPLPPLPLGPGGGAMARAFDALGWHWWPSDSAIASAPIDGREGCNHCGPCGVGCPRHARASVDLTYWPRALQAGATLVTGARVRRLIADRKDRIAAVEYVDAAGTAQRAVAKIVVLAANGMGSARLLLASASRAHPAGIGNDHDLVGRCLMHHPTAIVTGVFAARLDGYKGAFACALLSQEFYETDRARGFVRGYQMQLVRGSGPVATALGGYMARVPWGRDHHRRFRSEFAHTVSLTVTAEDLPEPDNRVTLDPVARDGAGVPAPRLAYRVSDNSRRILDHGIARASEVLRAAGAVDVVVNPLASAAGFHFLGTMRMGDDPARSVTDRWGRVHGTDNLYAIDGGVFVTSGAVNPTPTIQALALRSADHIAARLKEAA
ncbi:MAG: GMC family oxidoreductase [Alphaproteobacteria bacterium]|nr:GMC family oxidoreductase [Alphaproteobacteria bacterium]